MNPWVEPTVQHVVHRLTQLYPLPFGQGKRQKTKQCGTARERLIYCIGELEVFTAGEDEKTVLSPLIRHDLEVGQEAGDTLNLVQNGAGADLSQQATRVGFGELTLIRCFEVDVRQVGEGLAAQRGLTGLARSRHGHEGILPEEIDEAGSDVALNHDGKYNSTLNNLKVLLSNCSNLPTH